MVRVRFANGETAEFAGKARARAGLTETGFTIEADDEPEYDDMGNVLPIAVLHSGNILWVANVPRPEPAAEAE